MVRHHVSLSNLYRIPVSPWDPGSDGQSWNSTSFHKCMAVCCHLSALQLGVSGAPLVLCTKFQLSNVSEKLWNLFTSFQSSFFLSALAHYGKGDCKAERFDMYKQVLFSSPLKTMPFLLSLYNARRTKLVSVIPVILTTIIVTRYHHISTYYIRSLNDNSSWSL